MSDSEPNSSARLPSDPKLEECLRDIVSRVFKSGKHEDLTLRRVRTAAEEELDLPEGFFKADVKWKDRSQEIIGDEVSKRESRQEAPSSPEEKPKPVKKAPTKSNGADASKRGTKRPSPDAKPEPIKKQKVADSDDEGSELSSIKDIESDKQQEPVVSSAKHTQDDEEQLPEEKAEKVDESSSELSSLLDSPPPKKKKREKADSTKKKPAKAKKEKEKTKSKAVKVSKPAKAKDNSDASPQEAEIKRLQGWLVKCGIRKLWHRELASFSTDSAKISHLKEMLNDAGMDGRYSVEKARQIKERRELAADLEAVQEGNKMWGQESGEEEEADEARPKRRLAKGLKDLAAFMDDEESE
ncbi:hypothetical protein NA57DRAFT_73224 [Rhizodiscina lignyota]|uniref:Transcriptional regulator n=1 Tax=Rhizodiscina lignyota TaxID=1504668 RepID=A0A9P4IM38_9PEZI|nr:hypothetical protein NA57DRAFT_73224 [Rhizodiscina lignyota]